MTRPLSLAALLLALLAAPGRGAAEPEPALVPPRAGGVVLDGRLDEAAWEQAQRLPVPAVRVPTPAGPRDLRPDVRLLVSDGQLVVGVGAAEDPGVGIGLLLLLAPEGTPTAADAVALTYRPFDPRSPRLRALGPRGADRTRYRLQGAADASARGRWSLEVAVPCADVAADPAQRLRVALTVTTRTANVVATWPAGAAWHGPSAWRALEPGDAGWPQAAQVDAGRLATEDAAEDAARAAWLHYLQGTSTPVLPTLSRQQVLDEIGRNVLDPLTEVLRHRPELEAPVRCLRGDVFQRLGLWQEAADEFRRAGASMPGWREASFGLHLGVLGPRRAEGEPGGPSDYAAAFARIAADAAALDGSPWARDGVDLGRALLQAKHGEFDEALPVLRRLAAEHPSDAFLESQARFAESGRRAAAEEAARAARPREHPAPKAEVQTSRGRFVVELFPDDALNAVRSFVYLGQRKFYDGLAVHRSVPFFLVQSGDPHTRAGDPAPEKAGTGGASYVIRTERNARRMVRGAVVLASAGSDSESSQFYVLTGTAMHLQGEQTVFGRVLEGMEVVDALRAGDRIEAVTFRDLDPAERYVPQTVAGTEPDDR